MDEQNLKLTSLLDNVTEGLPYPTKTGPK
jgi:hypothetical protein